MSAPIDLAAERKRRIPEYDGLVCECGCAWWRARVVISATGCINGFATEDVTCNQCGRVAELQPMGVV